jgi:hypothetical protein
LAPEFIATGKKPWAICVFSTKCVFMFVVFPVAPIQRFVEGKQMRSGSDRSAAAISARRV